MCKFGLEITSVLSGTTCPVQVAQYDRYIHNIYALVHLLSYGQEQMRTEKRIENIL